MQNYLGYFDRNWTALFNSRELDADSSVKTVSDSLGLEMLTSKILKIRGYDTVEKAETFLKKRSEMLHDPFIMKDMEKGAKRILDAAENGEKTVIYGDYDVDGVTSVSILCLYLRELGADVSYYIPSRTGEGYGVSIAAVDKICGEGAELIVTVDTGITANAEAEYIRERGCELVITDHHECHGEIPNAFAVINPHRPDCEYPFKELAGVGVVFKLLCAMEKLRRPEDSLADCVRSIAEKYADLVAVGTIADVMPVTDENRLIVSLGLSIMEKSPNMAVSELLAASDGSSKYKAKKKITSGVIGFTVAPRINAAGRIKNASVAVEMFLSKDREETARYAAMLCEINRERQAEENRIAESAYEKIEREHDFEKCPVIVLDDDHWHHGVIGIVASRITEKYKRPSILISFEGSDSLGKGSGRSVKGMNLVDALRYSSDLLVKFGGHELAAGLTVTRENLPLFKEKINEYARKCFDGESPDTCVTADLEVDSFEIGMEAARELEYFEPFGVSNAVPVFLMRGVEVVSASNVGAGKHEKLTLSKDGVVFPAMYFRHNVAETDIFDGDTVDILFNIDINSFQGKESLQLIIKDMTLSGAVLEKERSDRRRLAKVLDGTYDFASASESVIAESVPTREDFAAVYSTLRREIRMEHDEFSIRGLSRLLADGGHDFSYVKLKLIIKIFQELNLLSADERDAEREIYRFGYTYAKTKTDLDKSSLYRKIKQSFGIKGQR